MTSNILFPFFAIRDARKCAVSSKLLQSLGLWVCGVFGYTFLGFLGIIVASELLGGHSQKHLMQAYIMTMLYFVTDLWYQSIRLPQK